MKISANHFFNMATGIVYIALNKARNFVRLQAKLIY